jgi:pimeloyl-ACP methyl ester carboxylesterase
MPATADITPPGLARLIVLFARHLELERATVVANDYGGALSQMALAGQPPELARAVLTSCDTFGQLPPRIFKPLRIVGRLLPRGFELLWGRFADPRAREVFLRSVAHRRIEPAIVDSYVRPFLDDPAVMRNFAKVSASVRPRYTLAAARALRRYPHPVLVAWGADDLWFARRNGRRLARTLPHGRFTLVPGARTFVPEDQPGRLAALIADFLDQTRRQNSASALAAR